MLPNNYLYLFIFIRGIFATSIFGFILFKAQKASTSGEGSLMEGGW